MKNLFEKLLHLKSQITLGGERKRAIKTQLLEHLDMDVRADESHRQQGRPARAWTSVLTLPYIKSMPITAIVGIILALTASASVAAEGSLPGDLLYSVKVGLTEEVRGALTFGTEADARWEARVAERRLEEAAKLSAHTDVKAETRAKLEADFKHASNQAQRHIHELRAQGDVQAAVEVAGDLEATLRGYESTLITIERKGNRERDSVNVLLHEVQEELQESVEVKATLETQANVEAKRSPSATPDVSPKQTASPRVSAPVRIDASGQGTIDLKLP